MDACDWQLWGQKSKFSKKNDTGRKGEDLTRSTAPRFKARDRATLTSISLFFDLQILVLFWAKTKKSPSEVSIRNEEAFLKFLKNA